MERTLTARGNGWLVILPKTLIKLLGLQPETSKVQFKIKNKILYVQEIFSDNPDYEKFLIRTLSKKGASYGFYMPNSILELIDVNPETDKLNLEIEDNILIIKKAE